jgi:hypothetical protein
MRLHGELLLVEEREKEDEKEEEEEEEEEGSWMIRVWEVTGNK